MASDTKTVNAQPEGYTNICKDGHACDNESTCVESLMHEHSYVCDCHNAYLQTGRAHAGLSCQHVATEYCTVTGEVSESLFCTNSGKCRSQVNLEDLHPGCTCPTGYAGDQCQYIVGSEPDPMSYFLDGTAATATDEGLHNIEEGPGIDPAAIVIPIMMVTLILLGYFLYKFRLLKGHLIDKTKMADENMMEADGSSSMKYHTSNNSLTNTSSGHRRNSTPAFSSSHKAALMDPPDFDDLLEQSDHVKFHNMDPTMSVTHKLFASDPTLNYNYTSDTSGTGSPTSYVEDYDMAALPAFEEYDPNDFTTSNTDATLT
jgi:hypothetical protein